MQALARFDAQKDTLPMPAISGALIKEVRLLYRIAHDAKAQPLDAAIRKHCHWPSKQRYLQLALAPQHPNVGPIYQRLYFG